LDERADDVMVTSELARAEVFRAIRRSNHDEQGELVDARLFTAELDEATAVLDALTQWLLIGMSWIGQAHSRRR
jgi:hypothetical protein